jgi:hypothetical protein
LAEKKCFKTTTKTKKKKEKKKPTLYNFIKGLKDIYQW